MFNRENEKKRKLEEERMARTRRLGESRNKNSSDDSFDTVGLATGMLTGIPVGPRGITSGSLMGSLLHSNPVNADDSNRSSSSYDSGSSSSYDSGSSLSFDSGSSSSGGGDF